MTGTASGTEIGMSHGSIAAVVGSGEVGERGDLGGEGTRARDMPSKELVHTLHEVLARSDGISFMMVDGVFPHWT